MRPRATSKKPLAWLGASCFSRSKSLACRPEGILLWLDPVPAGRFARTLRTAGYHGKLGGPGTLQSGDFLNAAAAASEGFLLPGPVLDEASRAAFARFAGAYRDRYQSEPDASAALAYDAAKLLVSVLRKAGSETPRRAFPLLETPPGASGVLSFDKEGNRKVTLNLLVCQNGTFTISPPTP
ncbi:MAG: ABC transporter substrate-binding protein [Verrucomicrobia bacterium]|nr:ABC transporter substrate-binding protein [Verrucomicrobiota bacterium]